jgi:predicted RNA-binding protein YlqC (UPF0109 family)
MKEFIEYLVQSVVDKPDEVVIDEEDREGKTTYVVHVAQDDLGKALGKHGRIANAMRVIVKASAMKGKRRVYLEVAGDRYNEHEAEAELQPA